MAKVECVPAAQYWADKIGVECEEQAAVAASRKPSPGSYGSFKHRPT